MNKLLRVAVFLLLAAQACLVHAQWATPSAKVAGAHTLKPYVDCDGFAEGIKSVKVDMRPTTNEPWREVDVAGTKRRVSVMNGYRVMFAYPGTDFFANLKVEQSDPGKYPSDKETLRQFMAETARSTVNVTLEDIKGQAFTGQTLTRKTLAGSTLGITQMFVDEDSVVVTIYFLNQHPDRRRFRTHEEFVFLRDKFIQGYTVCAARNRAISAYAPSTTP